MRKKLLCHPKQQHPIANATETMTNISLIFFFNFILSFSEFSFSHNMVYMEVFPLFIWKLPSIIITHSL